MLEGITTIKKAMAERMAINAPIQGTQSDIIKIAMAQIDDYLVKNSFEKDAQLLLQVHQGFYS